MNKYETEKPKESDGWKPIVIKSSVHRELKMLSLLFGIPISTLIEQSIPNLKSMYEVAEISKILSGEHLTYSQRSDTE